MQGIMPASIGHVQMITAPRHCTWTLGGIQHACRQPWWPGSLVLCDVVRAHRGSAWQELLRCGYAKTKRGAKRKEMRHRSARAVVWGLTAADQADQPDLGRGERIVPHAVAPSGRPPPHRDGGALRVQLVQNCSRTRRCQTSLFVSVRSEPSQEERRPT